MDLVSQNLLMTSGGKKDPTYVEDVFSTYLYKGNGAAQPINNGIKLGNSNAGNGVKFSGSSGQLEVASTSDFAFGTDPFTIEFWLYFQSVTDYCAMFEGRPNNGNGTYLTFGFASGYLSSYCDSAYRTQGSSGTTAPAVGQWTHIALVREGTGTNQEKIYFNGTQVAQGTNPVNIGNQRCMIAGHAWSRGDFNGHISNYRVTKGQALYTSNFTPSTQALTTTSQGAIASNVKLLCCNKNIVTGATVTPGTITVTSGNPVSQGFGPFTATDGEGGMTWIKSRTDTHYHNLIDTVRGPTKAVFSNHSMGQDTGTNGYMTSFNNNGFTTGTYNNVTNNNQDFTSWTFRKQKGFFDVLTYTGDGTKRDIAHNLGCVPGAIFVKRIDNSHNWGVYHRGLNEGVTPEKYRQRLNVAGQEDGNNANGYSYWADTAPTSTHFTVSDGTSGGQGTNTNVSGATYVAYLFAGGASTAATAPSVSFSGSNYLQVASSSDFAYGTGDFTMECWAKSTSNPAERILISNGTDYGYIGIYSQSGRTSVQYVGKGTSPHLMSDGFSVARNQWFHVAVSRNSGVSRLFLNGQLCNTQQTDTSNYAAGVVDIGRSSTSPNNPWVGNISNVRIVKGTGLYTSSFTPSTEPLKNVSGTVLLCCNDSSPTGSTVTPGTITNNNSVTASIDTPFDDPGGYKFGEEGDQNLIKCGQLTTDTTNGSYLDLPWEPQWLLIKQNNANNNWIILDSMRGWTDYGTDWMLYPNTSGTESQGSGYEEIMRNAIRFQGYGNNYDFMYIAIRRPEPLVSKPVEVGSNVFAMDTGNASTTTPVFDSGFPVDFAMNRAPGSATSWYTSARSMQDKYVLTNGNNTENTDTGARFDSNLGWAKDAYNTWNTNYQSWMWKRHAGFDVVPYFGNGQSNRQVKHNLARSPEMIWIKRRDQNGNDGDWMVGHKDLYGGSSPWNGYLVLNKSQGQYNDHHPFSNYTPTAVNFEVSNWNRVNNSGSEYISFLFASIEGISKVGTYDGSNSTQTITCGFQPRFFFQKRITGAGEWHTCDTLRGWGAGGDKFLYFDGNAAQGTYDFGAPTATGFTLTGGAHTVSGAGEKYIFYAHA